MILPSLRVGSHLFHYELTEKAFWQEKRFFFIISVKTNQGLMWAIAVSKTNLLFYFMRTNSTQIKYNPSYKNSPAIKVM